MLRLTYYREILRLCHLETVCGNDDADISRLLKSCASGRISFGLLRGVAPNHRAAKLVHVASFNDYVSMPFPKEDGLSFAEQQIGRESEGESERE